MVAKTPVSRIVLTHFVCCSDVRGSVKRRRGYEVIMDTSDTESDLEVIPMKRCSGQRSKSLPFNTLRTSTTGSAPNVGLVLKEGGQQPPTTLKVSQNFSFESHSG